MTPLAALLGELRRAQVRVWAEGEALRYQAPPGGLPPELLAELRRRKAEVLAFCREARAEAAALALAPAPATAPPEMSLAQRRLWLLHHLNGPDPAYNIPLALRLRGDLDLPALQESLAAILRRHEGLRTAFRAEGEEARPVLAGPGPLPWTETDLRHLSADRRIEAARRLVLEAALQPFDLGQAPLVRFGLWRLDSDDHVLLLNLHHIVADGRSIEVLAEDLAALYRACRLGAGAALPELPIRYADFAWHQRRQLSEQALQGQLGYWRERLAGMPPLLELPADRPRSTVSSSAGATVAETLEAPLVERLTRLAQRSGTTLYTVLLAGFAALLARYTDRTDIAIACPATHRTRPELDRLVGFFVNTLVIRLDLSGDPGFGEILRRAHEAVTGAFAHQDVPFEMVVEVLRVERSPSHAPLAQVSLAMLSAERARPRLHGLNTEPFDFGGSVARHDLSLEVYEADGALKVFWIYATSLFEAATARRMARHLRTLLEAATAAPEWNLADLPLLDAAEIRQLTRDWNATRADPPATAFLHRAFEAQARRTPDATALVADGEALTYRELNARANRLAHRLVAAGIGQEGRVGICLGRSAAMVVGILAVLKAGGAYVPLDPANPGARSAAMLRDANARLLLADAWCPEEAAKGGWPVMRLDTPDGDAPGRDHDPAVPLSAGNLAYVIYTSGSTGQPKGCQIEHRNLMHYLHWAARCCYGEGEGGSFGLFTSIAFDLTVTSLFLPLLRGRTLQIFPQDMALDDALRAQFDPASGLDSVKLTPAHLTLLPSLGLPRSAVSVVVVGGEQLLPEQVAGLRALNPKMRIFNEYGPTETTVGCTVKEVPRGEERILIGQPIDNTRVYVLDRHLRPQPIGVPGELYIGGAGVGRGYLNRPELTAERFVPDPFATEPGERLYRSGDLARWTAGGELECLGRLDDQVKIRGFRIELGEIEAILGRHPAVRQAAVLAPQEDAARRRIVAFAGAPDAPQAEELLRFLGERLPGHMMPAGLVVLDRLPLTVNGKIDRAALARLASSAVAPQASYAPPRTEAERLLAGIWAQLLRLERVGIHDDFFRLGGDSILGIQAVARANQAGLRVTPRLLLHHPTVSGLARAAEGGAPAGPTRRKRSGPVPLTPIQHWFFEQDRPDPHHFNQALLLELRHPMQATRLAEALRHLFRYHDALRLRFRPGRKGWTQKVSPPDGDLPLELVDLSTLDPAARRAAIEARAAELQTRLSLDGPLVRVAYFECGAGEAPRLLWIIHHLATDGVSWRILLEDLFALYRQSEQGEPLRLPAATTAFEDWAHRLAEYAGSDELAQEGAIWLRDDTTALRLLVDHAEGPNDEASSRILHFSLEEQETDTLLRGVPQAHGVGIREVLLAALAHALAGWLGPGPMLLDLEGHGRESIFDEFDLTRSVGWFTTITPVWLRLNPMEDRAASLRAMRSRLRRLPNGGLGYGVLRYLGKDAELARRLRTQPQAEFCFNYLGQFDRAKSEELPFHKAVESPGPCSSPRGLRRHLLRFDGQVEDGRLQFRLQYSANRHLPETAEKIGRGFIEALRGCVRECHSDATAQAPPAEFPLAKLNRDELSKVARLIEAGRRR